MKDFPIIKPTKLNFNPKQTIVPGNIYDAAIVRGMTLEDVANKLRWPKAKIVRMNDGRLKPHNSDLVRLCNLLQQPLRFFFHVFPEIEGPIFICEKVNECYCHD